MKGIRGAIDPVTLILVGALAAGVIGGGWKPSNWFKKAPPTEQLTKLQAELEQAKKAAEQAEKDKQAAIAAERAKLETQIRSAQADNLGTETALKKVRPEGQTPEVKLAARMAQRVSLKLATAIGRLPVEEQEAMVTLIEQALSDKQAEVDEANRKLAEADAQFKAVTGEREQLKAQIPVLSERARKAEEMASLKASEVGAKTEEIKKVADKLYQADQENGSLWSNVKRGAFILGGIYLFLAVGLPAIVKHMAPGNPLKSVLRDISGLTLNPLLHLDAKHKIKEALYTPVPTDPISR